MATFGNRNNNKISKFLLWERRSHAFPPHYTTGRVYKPLNFFRFHKKNITIDKQRGKNKNEEEGMDVGGSGRGGGGVKLR